MAAHDVVVAGHICLDLTPKFRGQAAGSLSDILAPGALVVVDECVVSTGGTVPNTGLALVKLGVDALLMGKVGEDAFGAMVVEKLAEYGRGDGIVRVPGEHTSYTVIVAPPGIDRMFLHHPGANDTFDHADINYGAVAEARVFHLGYPPLLRRTYEDGGETLAAMFEEAKNRGATTSLDMTMPDPNAASGRADWEAILRRALPHVDLFLPSAEEVLYCLDRPLFFELRARAEAEESTLTDLIPAARCGIMAERLIDWGAGVVMLKAGHRGIYLRTADSGRLGDVGRAAPGDVSQWAGRELWAPPYRVERVASATGAGDCAVAGFLSAFLEGESPERALRVAAAAGAENVTAHDAISGLSSYSELVGKLDSVPVGDAGLDGPDWQYDEPLYVWRGSSD